MAQTVQIEVGIDDQGVVTGVQNIRGSFNDLNSGLQKTGQQGNVVFTSMTKNIHDSHAAAQLFVRETGVNMPRALESVIARSQILGPALKAALPVAVFAAFLPILEQMYAKLNDMTSAAGGFTEAVKKINEENVKANAAAWLDPKTVAQAIDRVKFTNDQIAAQEKLIAGMREEGGLNDKVAAGEESVVALIGQQWEAEKKINQATADRQKLIEAQGKLQLKINEENLKAADSIALIGKEGFSKIAQEQANALKEAQAAYGTGGSTPDAAQLATAVTQAAAKASAERLELVRKEHDETVKLQNEVVLGYLEGDDKIVAKAEQTYAEKLALWQRGAMSAQALYDFDVANHDKEQQELLDALRKRIHAEVEISDQFHAQTLEAVNRAQTQELEGTARIYAEEKQLLDHYQQEYQTEMQKAADNDSIRKKLTMDEDTREAAVKIETTQKVAAILEKASLETQQLNEKAAIAMLPPWQQADAQIVADFQDAQRKLQEELKSTPELAAQYDQRIRDEAVLANTKMANDLATQLQSVFDDITSGNIGQTILKNFEKFFFQIAAQWLITTGTMQQYSSLLGPLLGINIPGAVGGGMGLGGFGMSAASLMPGVLGMGGTAAGTTYLGGGSTASAGAALAPWLAAGGTGSAAMGTGITPFLGAGAGGGGLLNGSGAPGMTLDQQIAAQGGVNQLLGVPQLSGAALAGGGKGMFSSIGGLASMLPIGGGLLGNLVGGTPGAIGGGMLGLIASLALKGTLPAWMGWATGGLGGGLLAGAGGGLLGYGVGQQYGTVAGIGSGAGSGALMGLMLDGPIGAIIGGILGLLGGLFGGLGGGAARTKAAQQFTDQQKAAADQIEAQFKAFQLDYPTALTDLEQIKTNAYEQMRKLKSEGTRYYNRDLAPYIDKIETELKGYQDERDRRSTLAIAPPQFASGGTVMGYGGGGIGIIAHAGEEIINPAASARNRPLLKAINSGASVPMSGGDLHVHGPLIQANRIDEAWLRNGGAVQITQAIRRARMEGKSAI